MTELSTHIPLEVVKSNEDINLCDRFYYEVNTLTGNHKIGYPDGKPMIDGFEYYHAPTIADIIDNAEELFGEEYRCNECSKIMTKCKDVYLFECVTCGIAHGGYLGKHIGYILITSKILDMCQQDKSIENISKYIINNIK